MHRLWFLGALVLVGVLHPAAAFSQGALIHGSAAAALTDGSTELAFGGGVGYRLNHVLGFGVELSRIQILEPVVYVLGPRSDRFDSNAVVFTGNVRVEIPSVGRRVIPYVTGGAGLANVSRPYPIVYALSNVAREFLPGLSAILPRPPTFVDPGVSMTLMLGGGASFLLTDHVSIDADIRVLRLAGDESRTIGRVGGGVGYRF